MAHDTINISFHNNKKRIPKLLLRNSILEPGNAELHTALLILENIAYSFETNTSASTKTFLVLRSSNLRGWRALIGKREGFKKWLGVLLKPSQGFTAARAL